jgi:protein involved in polysaccharide export with SLBB domain
MKKALLISIFSLLALAPFESVFAQTASDAVTTAAASSKAVPSVSPPIEQSSAAIPETASAPATSPTSDPAATAPTTKTGSIDTPPNIEASAPTDVYTVGVGDVLDIRFLNSANNRSTLFSVIEGGVIDLPIAGGPLPVAGLTTKDIQTRITAELKRLAVEDRTQVTVGVRQFASHAVIISGLVGSPGTKFLRREAVPLYVLLAEVQPRLDAARASIMRAGVPTQVVELGDSDAINFLVRPGDVLNLTARPQEFYYIGGRISYPGQKAFQPGITLIQAILAAGGSARNSVVELSREGSEGRLTSATFNLKEIKAGKIEDPNLQAGDRVEVLR